MSVTSVTTQDTHRKIIGTAATMRALNCSRWKLWDMCRNDDDFPKPRDIAGKNQWFEDEIETYKESRPRRIYTAVIALVIMVAQFFTTPAA